jgi:hypothetical protein
VPNLDPKNVASGLTRGVGGLSLGVHLTKNW